MTTAKHTVFYTHGAGRLGNQIVRFVHWIAWVKAREGEVDVCNLAFWPYARFFEEWVSHPGCIFPSRGSNMDTAARLMRCLPIRGVKFAVNRDRLGRLAQLTTRTVIGGQVRRLDVLAEEELDLGDKRFMDFVRCQRYTAVSGWKIQNWSLVEKQQESLRRYFRPAEKWRWGRANWMVGLRREYDTMVGVHIRMGDYGTWHYGRFLFSVRDYADWMRQVLDLRVGSRIIFVVVSDEPLDEREFAGLPVCFPSSDKERGFTDWIALCGCDLIIGPPSTFSATAAFVGGGKIWPVAETKQKMAIAQIIENGLFGASRHPQFSLAVM